jgi:hypothetical protein
VGPSPTDATPSPPAQQPPDFAAQQALQMPSAAPPGPPPPPAVQPGFGGTADNAMTQFLHGPLESIGSPNPRHPPPQQHSSQYQQHGVPVPPTHDRLETMSNASAATSGWHQDPHGAPGQLIVSQSRAASTVGGMPAVSHPREQLPPAPMASASPRRSVSVKALPQVKMTHTPLGQVQLPSMPPVNVPSVAEPQRAGQEDGAAWTAFTDLRKQLEDSHGRTLGLHQEISRMQIAHEKEAAALQASVKAQLENQARELQDMTDNYNSATSKLDQLTGVLARKADEVCRLEQKMHAAEIDKVATDQRVAHVEDRVKLADHARQVAEVRTRELELSLEHATTLIQSLRRQLSVANDEKNNALTDQYNTFEANRQQLIEFYAEREQFMLGSYAESLSSVQLSMQQYLNEREAEVESKWENTFQAQLDHQKSLHTELVTRADNHVAEMTALKEKQEEEKEKALAHMQREIRLADERAQERMKNLVEDITRREQELGEREQRMRVNVANAEQESKLKLLSREAEMKAQYDRLLDDAKDEFTKDRDRLSVAYREQIASLSAQHMANERELERLHREKEREMAQRYRIANWEEDNRRGAADSTNATATSQNNLLARMDKMAADQEARRLATKARFQGTAASGGGGGGGGGSPAPEGSP